MAEKQKKSISIKIRTLSQPSLHSILQRCQADVLENIKGKSTCITVTRAETSADIDIWQVAIDVHYLPAMLPAGEQEILCSVNNNEAFIRCYLFIYHYIIAVWDNLYYVFD